MNVSLKSPAVSQAQIEKLWKLDKELGKPEIPERVFEKIQGGEIDFLPAWFLDVGAKTAKAVCHLIFSEGGKDYVGTGFMITHDLMMTNNHVFSSHVVAKTGKAIFNYQKDQQGRLEQSETFSVNPDRFFITNETLDFTIVAVDGSPGKKYGFVQLLRNWKKVGVGDHVHIIQHPAGDPKQVVLYSNEVTGFSPTTLKYKTDTVGGSSGSPVFNDLWQPVALHHVGTATHNEGIRISAILKYLGLLESRERGNPLLAGLMNSIPDSNDFGFFDMAGLEPEADELFEKVALSYRGDDDFLDIGYWNIEHFNRNASSERVEAIADLVEKMRLDVFGLTEVSKEAMKSLVEALNRRGLTYDYQLEDVSGGQDIAILYDSSVASLEDIPFSEEHLEFLKEKIRNKDVFPRLPMQRRVFVSRGNKSRTFIMMVLHLKAFGDRLSRERRRRAAEILRHIIDDLIERGTSDIVVGGDMNEVLEHGAFDAMTNGQGLVALTADDAAAGGDAVSWIGGSGKSLIDHIFVSRDALKMSVDDSITITRLDKNIPDFDDTLSDHIPVIFRALFGSEPVEPSEAVREVEIGGYVKKIVVHE